MPRFFSGGDGVEAVEKSSTFAAVAIEATATAALPVVKKPGVSSAVRQIVNTNKQSMGEPITAIVSASIVSAWPKLLLLA